MDAVSVTSIDSLSDWTRTQLDGDDGDSATVASVHSDDGLLATAQAPLDTHTAHAQHQPQPVAQEQRGDAAGPAPAHVPAAQQDEHAAAADAQPQPQPQPQPQVPVAAVAPVARPAPVPAPAAAVAPVRRANGAITGGVFAGLVPPPGRNAPPPDRRRLAELYRAGLLQAARAPGVPVTLRRAHTAWLVNIRCCRHGCPLCRHRRRDASTAVAAAGRAGRWPDCSLCFGTVPDSAMIACGGCHQPVCIMCLMKTIAAADCRTLNDAMQGHRMVTCPLCRHPRAHDQLSVASRCYRAHRQHIAVRCSTVCTLAQLANARRPADTVTGEVPRLWTREGRVAAAMVDAPLPLLPGPP